jgi:putative transposase
MARLGRYFVAGQPLHVIQRGNGSGRIFFTEADFAQYRAWLIEAAQAYGLAVHAYVLMPDHVHLLVTPSSAESLPRTMQSLGRRYVRHINARTGRTGTLWEGRYRAAPIDSDEYFIACCRYIEMNPVRARRVAYPRDWRWSSYRAHAQGGADALAAFHPLLRRLGRSLAERQQAWRALARKKLDPAFVRALRDATNGGWALGDERFRKEIARRAKRRAAPLPRGPRPAAGATRRQRKRP